MDDRTFLELFRIRTEDTDEHGMPAVVPFHLRSVQVDLHELEDRCEFVDRTFTQVHVPKARKHGVSTHSIARYGFARILRRPGYETTQVAQSIAATSSHRATLEYLYAQVDWAALRELGYVLVESTRRTVAIRHPNGLVSKVTLLTARSDGLGRGGTPNAVLSTERPFYPRKAREDFSGILGSLRKVRGNAWVDESTANGEDEFYDDVMRARDRRGIAKLLFFPAYRHELNYLPFENDAARAAFVEKLGDPYYGEREEEALVRGRVVAFQRREGLTPEAADLKALDFLHWRRLEVDTTCRGSIDYLKRENPTILEEAFVGSGKPVYRVDILRTWGDAAQAYQRSGTTGRVREVENGDIKFEPHHGSGLIVLEPPRKELVYAFGCDVASGRRFQSGTGISADFSVLNMKDVYSGRTVAKLRDHIGTMELARQLVWLCRWYCDADEEPAQGLVELGGGYGDAVVAAVLEIENGAWSHVLMTTTTDVRSRVGHEQEILYGFSASRQGKGVLAARMEAFINEEVGFYRPPNPGELEAACPWDAETLSELKRYHYNERGGMEAVTGFDDAAVAEMLAIHARARRLNDGDIPAPSPVKPRKLESDARRALRAQDEKASRKETQDAERVWLPGY